MAPKVLPDDAARGPSMWQSLTCKCRCQLVGRRLAVPLGGVARDQLPLAPAHGVCTPTNRGQSRGSINLSLRGVASATWVNDGVLAMSRPSAKGLHEHGLLQQLQTSGVKLVFNLQRPGEHPFCGEALVRTTGFTYDPKDLDSAGIETVLAPWSAPTAAGLAALVDKADAVLRLGHKVAVHSHTGNGRTGVLVACILVQWLDVDARTAVDTVRSRRPGCLRSRRHVSLVADFAKARHPTSAPSPTATGSTRIVVAEKTRAPPEQANEPDGGSAAWYIDDGGSGINYYLNEP